MFTEIQIKHFLELSLEEATQAFTENNYPIGSVIVNSNGAVVAKTRNNCATEYDITAHAEIIALRQLGDEINKNTKDAHYLFTSLEPCFGCSFFIARSNIKAIYSAFKDPHKGGISDLAFQKQFSDFFKKIDLYNEPFDDCAVKSKELMRTYFINTGNHAAAECYN